MTCIFNYPKVCLLLVPLLALMRSLALSSIEQAPGAFALTSSFGARCIGPTYDDTAAFQAAIDTGRTVYAPAMGGRCHLTHALVMHTAGQIFRGDGRARTKIEISPGFQGAGVFVARTGEPGPIWRDFSISFAQSETDRFNELEPYPPGFEATYTPRFSIENVGCSLAIWCVRMEGNSGGSSFTDVQMSAFQGGISIDGSLDTVRVSSLHWYPFQMSSKQTRLFSGSTGCPVGIKSGRMDNLIIAGSLFGGCLGVHIFKGNQGSTSASISNSNFDTYSGLRQEGGVVLVNNSHFAVESPKAQAVIATGGILSITGSFFLAAADGESPLVENVGSAHFSLIGNTFLMAGRDVTSVAQRGGAAFLQGNTFLRDNAGTAAKPIIEAMGGEVALVTNQVTTSTPGRGIFVRK